MSEAVLVSVQDGVAHLVLNRPEVANAFDLPSAKTLVQAVERCEEDDVRVVVVTGAGKRFCAGGDVRSFVSEPDQSAYLHELAGTVGTAFRRLSELAKPVVAGVHGAVAGAGLSFVLSADLIFSTPSTKFTMAFSGIGLTPDSGVSYLLPQVVGLRRALDLALTQRVLSAQEALEWGLVSELVEDEDLLDRSLQTARRLAEGPAAAFGHARRLLRSAYDTGREAHDQDEAATIAAAVTGPEASELIARFLGK